MKFFHDTLNSSFEVLEVHDDFLEIIFLDSPKVFSKYQPGDRIKLILTTHNQNSIRPMDEDAFELFLKL